ncbi:MAG: hypothetical protein KAT65_11790 [Methanophagales archaeon]|nr:hypothetical protein [Methanophagales archaeon]
MIIKETEDSWRCIFFKDARDTSVKDEREKGYVVQFGEFREQAVPKYIDYSKANFSLEKAIQYAKNIKECAICKTLNANVDKIESMDLKDQYKKPEVTLDNTKEELTQLKKEIVELKSLMKPERKNVVEGVMSDITKDVIKTIFTVPGRIDMYLTTGDEAFIEDLIPERPTKEDVLEIRAQVADFWAGDIGRVRNEEQMKAYAKQQRDLIKTLRGEEIEEEEPKKKKFGGKKVKVVA